jgi:hypothetical protein
LRQLASRYLYWLALPAMLLPGVILGWLLAGRLPLTLLLERTGLVTAEPFIVPAEAQGQLELYVLAGQSNMSGRGELAAVPVTHPQTFLFGNDYRWHLAAEPLDSNQDQVDLVSMESPTDEAGHGPGMAFALALLAANPKRQIGLIPCARGGTSLAEWSPSQATNTLYGACLQRIAAAGTQGRLAGVLFFQGENDALRADAFPSEQVRTGAGYGALFTAWIEQLRHDLDRPDLPVIFAQIGTNDRPEFFVNWELIQREQASVNLACTAMIKTEDLDLRDAVHFTSASYDEIGARFAQAYLALSNSTDCEG